MPKNLLLAIKSRSFVAALLRMTINLKKTFLLLLMLALSLMAVPAAGAQEGPVPPLIGGKAAVLVNADNGRVLYSLNPDEQLPMASTTKMMTALIIIESHRDLNARVTVSQRAAEVGESSIWLQAGESLTVYEMLTGMLVQSGNDAAMALAEFHAGSVEAFVDKMNLRAGELGMKNTHFVNPHGLDDPQHYTSAADFARLAGELMKHPEAREIVKHSEATIPWTGQPYGRALINHNYLLDRNPFVNGIKTGYTDVAGQCIVISAANNGVNLILAYLGGPSLGQRDQDVAGLLQFGFDSYQMVTVISAGEEYASLNVPYHWGRRLSLVSSDTVSQPVYVKDNVKHEVTLPEAPRLPVHKGDKIGLVEAYDGSELLGSAYLVATEDFEEAGLNDRIAYFIEAVYRTLLSVVTPS